MQLPHTVSVTRQCLPTGSVVWPDDLVSKAVQGDVTPRL